MAKRARTIPADAPAALVIGDKVTAFDPTNPAHLNWLGIMLEGMREKLGATMIYPPALDDVISQADIADWAMQHGQYEKAMATRAWTMLWRAVQCPSKTPWLATMLHEHERRAGVIPLGLLVGKAPFLGSLWGSSCSLTQWQQLVRAYLQSRGLRVGMDTRAWLQVREQALNACPQP